MQVTFATMAYRHLAVPFANAGTKTKANDVAAVEEPHTNPSDDAAMRALSKDGVTVKNIWQLSRSKFTTKQVQDRLRACKTDHRMISMIVGLRGHVWEASKDPHAHHVLQVIVELAPCSDIQWLVKEMCGGGIVKASKHRFQCRVVQRLLEYFVPSKILEWQQVLDDILEDPTVVQELCLHNFGNYVMSVLLKHGLNSHRAKIMDLLRARCSTLGADNNGAAVLLSALDYDTDISVSEKEELATAIVRARTSNGHLITRMARTRHGHSTVKAALQVLLRSRKKGAEETLKDALNGLRDAEDTLQADRYGRASVTFAKEELKKLCGLVARRNCENE
jgi:hypothetical protein